MAWITFTPEHIKARLIDVELEAYEDAGDIDVETKLDGIIPQVVGMVRGKVSSCEDVISLGAAGEIPDELLWAASTIAKYSLISVIGGLDEQHDKLRMEENRTAHKQLDDAASCKISIAPPSGIEPEARPSDCGGNPLLEF
jgi:hypothetical protein